MGNICTNTVPTGKRDKGREAGGKKEVHSKCRLKQREDRKDRMFEKGNIRKRKIKNGRKEGKKES